MNLEQLNNDFRKNDDLHPWNPNLRALGIAKRIMIKDYNHKTLGSVVKDPLVAVADAKKNSSPGYLFKKLGCKTRKDVFDKMLPKLLDMVLKIADGDSVQTIWESAPKVEIRALLKLLNPDLSKRKVRTFLVADTLFYLVGTILYSDQNDIYVNNTSIDDWSAVGSTIFHGGFDQTTNYLIQFGRKVRTYDISHMESSCSPAIFELVYDIRNSVIVGHEELKQWFFANKVFSLVLDPNGRICLQIGTNPSGCSNTLSDNNITVETVNTYHVVIRTLEEFPFYSDDSIQKEVERLKKLLPVKIMGDDSIMGDNPIWDGLPESALHLGFVYTEEVGLDGSFPMDITQARFLNFGFRYEVSRNMWHFVPNFDKLFAGLFFLRKKNSWRLTLAKLYALRVLCFQFPRYRYELEQYIILVWNKHDAQLRSENFKDVLGVEILPYDQLRSMHLSVPEIHFLHFGLECGLREPPSDFFYQMESFWTLLEC